MIPLSSLIIINTSKKIFLFGTKASNNNVEGYGNITSSFAVSFSFGAKHIPVSNLHNKVSQVFNKNYGPALKCNVFKSRTKKGLFII